MPYIPRSPVIQPCVHCGQPFESRNLRRKYCSNSCNVLASYARTGRRGEARPTKADLEATVNTLAGLLGIKNPEQNRKLVGIDPTLGARLVAAREKARDLSTKKRLEDSKAKLAELAKNLRDESELEDGLASAEEQFQQLAAKREQQAKKLAGAKERAKALNKRRERGS